MKKIGKERTEEERKREEGIREERREEWGEVKEKGEVGAPGHCLPSQSTF